MHILITIISLLLLTACGVSQVREAEITKSEPTAKIVRPPVPEPTVGKPTAVPLVLRPLKKRKRSQWTGKTPQQSGLAPEDHDDVWARIRAGLSLPRYLDEPSVRSKLKWYSERQAYLDRVAKRATPYIHHIVEQLKARNMPLELALLPIVESAYQPLAYSRSHAAGIWQFIPATGVRFGLKQNWWYDGRRDITAATQAALDYLQFLNNEFQGDWLHSLAAYNAGENKVHRAIAVNRTTGRPTDFWSLALPTETRGYVPALLAVAEIVARPARYGVTLQPIPNRPYFRQVATEGQIDLKKAAGLAGISEGEMKRLNPGFKRWATDPDGPHGLLIPIAKADHFASAVAQLPRSERVSWRRHQVRRGETLSQIARRYGTSVPVLQQTNQINGHIIQVGRNLLIPAAGGGSSRAVAAAAGNRSAVAASAANTHHTVLKGETLWAISRRYGHSVDDITAVNGLKSHSILQPGQRLQLPAMLATAEKGTQPVRYIVRNGDSLWAISRRFRVPVSALREWNRLDSEVPLRPGQELELYVDTSQPHGI